MCAFYLNVRLCTMHRQFLWCPEKDIGSSATGVTEQYWPPCGCWVTNSHPVHEQPVFLTAELSLQPWERSLSAIRGHQGPESLRFSEYSPECAWDSTIRD